MNSDRLLFDAKAMALKLVPNYKPAEPYTYRLPGRAGKAAINMVVGAMKALGKVTPHDEVVVDVLADVLSGGETSFLKSLTEDELYTLEFNGFMKLIHHPDTIKRIEHMLETGKPLRN
jgi:3-hydroxyacyl-CoA dehydrogenase